MIVAQALHKRFSEVVAVGFSPDEVNTMDVAGGGARLALPAAVNNAPPVAEELSQP